MPLSLRQYAGEAPPDVELTEEELAALESGVVPAAPVPAPAEPVDVKQENIAKLLASFGNVPAVPPAPGRMSLDDARSADRVQNNARAIESAARQAIGGLTLTKPADVSTEKGNAEKTTLAGLENDRQESIEARKNALALRQRALETLMHPDRPAPAAKPPPNQELVDAEIGLKKARAAYLARPPTSKAAKAPKDTSAKDSSALRKEFDSLPEVKSFKDVSIGMDKIKTAAKSGTAPGDMALIFAYMKILDPGSSVKEGEYASAKDAQGVPDKVLTAYNKARAGEILSPDTRKAFLKEAEGLFETERSRYSGAAKRYRGLAEKQKLSPDDVAMDRELGGQSPSGPTVRIKRLSDGKVVPMSKAEADTLDMKLYEVVP